MYMKNVMYKIIMGCYIVAALVLVTACNDNLDIPFGGKIGCGRFRKVFRRHLRSIIITVRMRV